MSHVEYAPRAALRLEKTEVGTDRRTDGRTPDCCITLTARCGQRNARYTPATMSKQHVEATGNFVASCLNIVAVFGNNVEATFDFFVLYCIIHVF